MSWNIFFLRHCWYSKFLSVEAALWCLRPRRLRRHNGLVNLTRSSEQIWFFVFILLLIQQSVHWFSSARASVCFLSTRDTPFRKFNVRIFKLRMYFVCPAHFLMRRKFVLLQDVHVAIYIRNIFLPNQIDHIKIDLVVGHQKHANKKDRFKINRPKHLHTQYWSSTQLQN